MDWQSVNDNIFIMSDLLNSQPFIPVQVLFTMGSIWNIYNPGQILGSFLSDSILLRDAFGNQSQSSIISY